MATKMSNSYTSTISQTLDPPTTSTMYLPLSVERMKEIQLFFLDGGGFVLRIGRDDKETILFASNVDDLKEKLVVYLVANKMEGK